MKATFQIAVQEQIPMTSVNKLNLLENAFLTSLLSENLLHLLENRKEYILRIYRMHSCLKSTVHQALLRLSIYHKQKPIPHGTLT